MMSLLKESLSDHVKEVRLTNRLKDSPACLVVADEDLSPQMERILRAQQGHVEKQLRILELNPNHEIVQKLQTRVKADKADPLIADYAHLLFGGALIAEGSELGDPAPFNRALIQLMEKHI